jgi:ribose transport system substrate-binding protein
MSIRQLGWALALAFCLTTGCQRGAKQRIGMVVTTLGNPYFVDMTNAAKLEAQKHSDVTLIVQAPNAATDADRQLQIVEDLIAQHVQALCVVPADSKGIIRAIAMANKANIPFFVLDNKVDDKVAAAAGVTITSFIGSNNYLGGQLAGQFMGKALNGKGTVAILEGVTGVEAAVQRKAGFLDAMKAFPGIQLVASQPADFDREKGLNVTQSILEVNPKLNGLFASNDEMALGAVQAIKGKAGKRPIIVGFDATRDGLAAIKAGDMDATIAQLPAEVGRLGVATAIDKIQGKDVPAVIPINVRLVTADAGLTD